jgi:RNA polymerase sigma-70 factor (ECF subfamily)
MAPDDGMAPDDTAQQDPSSGATLLHAEDLELVRRLQEGEQEAFDGFWSEHAARLYRFASHRANGDQELAREAVQAALCTALENLGRYRGEGSLYSWICGICKFELLARLRKRNRFVKDVELDALPEGGGVLAQLLAAPGGPEVELLREEARRTVHQVLDRLPPRYARVLELKYAQRLSTRDVARLSATTEKAVESLLVRARKAFRAAFARVAEDAASVEPIVAGWNRER